MRLIYSPAGRLPKSRMSGNSPELVLAIGLSNYYTKRM